MPHISEPPPAGTRVLSLTNWIGVVHLKNMLDPVDVHLLRQGAAPAIGHYYLNGYAELSGGWKTQPPTTGTSRSSGKRCVLGRLGSQ